MSEQQASPRVRQAMQRAVRLASRGHGLVEPNPMVGCVLLDENDRMISEGFHTRLGAAHAEVEALRAAGSRARGATAVITLEPCNHQGRTGPCTDALLQAGVRRVFYAVADPFPRAAGGAQRLRAAGMEVHQLRSSAAEELALPFLKRVLTRLPWITVKWAASIDGRIALSSKASKWISGERARRMVHRERGRVDAVMTGIGTVLADDPRLNARDVSIRRVAMRVVYDPLAHTPPQCAMLARAEDGRVAILVLPAALRDDEVAARAHALERAGATLVDLGTEGQVTPACAALFELGVSTMLVEAGGGLVGKLFAEQLVDEIFTFIGPIVIGDANAISSVRGLRTDAMTDAVHARLIAVRRRGDDALLHYRCTSLQSLGLQ
ncbi:MAG: bifunctional diaminohydroxyphosphoribosylaminopyrimidine deaminase/5-amino-6-(5-phosphoribosylamino)uracil reductase RibD [Phycisphaerales bacterium]|nr:bifunctional diaminohydroxyphosphoribosylaminopyrimidine deaminase/5-amino-6-(5-phosphoribosylamino)uracil reductase RibD [Phycisphaerales bacterium]